MARIITGIEQNDHRIQAVEISVDRKKVRIRRFVEEIPDTDSLSPEALSLFVSKHAIQKENVVTSVPGDMLITRRVHVPFRDRSRIDKVISFEVEPLVPFPIQELEMCYRILNQGREGSDLLVYALPRSILDRRSSLFKEAGIPLRMITVSTLAAANTLFQIRKIQEQGFYLHLHVGSTFSILSIYERGTLTHLQRLSWSEGTFLATVGKVTGLDPITLSERLRDLSASETSQLLDALRDETIEIVPQIRRVLHAYRIHAAAKSPEALYVTGTTSGLSLLAPLLETGLSIKAEAPDPVSAFEHDLRNIRENTGIHAVLGMALMEGRRDASMCAFRKEKFSLTSKISESKRELRYAAIVMIFLFCAFVADLFVGIQTKEYRFRQLQEESRRIFHETFPDEKSVRNELEQMKLGIKEIEKQNVIFKTLFGEKPTPLEILNELSSRIPEKIDLAVTDLTIDENSMRFVGWTDSFNSVNLIEQELKKSDILGTVKVSNAKVGKDKNRVNFQMKISFRES